MTRVRGSGRGSERWSNSGSISKGEPDGFAKDLLGHVRQTEQPGGIPSIGLRRGKNEVASY